MPGIVTGVKKTGKQLAIDTAKRMAREPVEILKTASVQLRGGERSAPAPEVGKTQAGEPEQKQAVDEAKLKVQGQRQVQALEKEIEDIRRLKLEEAQKQIQVEEIQEEQEKAQVPRTPPQISTKPKRGLLAGFGKGRKMTQMAQQTGTSRAEFRKPPSG